MKKLISSIIIVSALASHASFAAPQITKEQRKEFFKECRKEAKADGFNMKDKEGLKKFVRQCAKEKIKAFKKQNK